MKSFRIISTSPALAIFSSLAMFFAGIFPIAKFLRHNAVLFWASIIIVVALIFYVQRFISKAKVIINLTKEIVSIDWKQQFIFHKRPNRTIQWDEIKSYKYQEDRNFDLFRITLLDGTELNFWHSTFTKDDFDILVYSFPEYVKKHNNKKNESQSNGANIYHAQKIEREKTIFENAASPFFVFLAIFFIVAISAIMILKKDKSDNPFLGLAALSGAIFYLAKYLQYRKKEADKKN